MFVDRAGRAGGALLLLLCTTVLSVSVPSLSLIASGLVVAWLAMGIAVKREYLGSFRRALEKKIIEPEALELRRIDGATIQTLLTLLSSHDERQVLYALDLLSNTHPNRWRGHINRLIHHPSSTVRARTIAVLAGWNDPAIARGDFIRHPDYETARIAMASALRLHWTDLANDRELLNRLLRDPSIPVLREAIVTAGVVGYTDAMPHLIEKLADKRLRTEARRALLNFGGAMIPELVRRLSNPAEDPRIRKRIPKTLALTGNQEAANALIYHLHRFDYHVDYAILKALNRMRVNSPEIVIDPAVVRAAINKEHEEYEKLKAMYVWLETRRIPHEVFSLLMRALHERIQDRRERIFRLVGLIYSPHDIYSVYYNYRIKPALRPAAIEFLDNILDAPLKETVVPLLEEACDPEKAVCVRQPVEFISLDAALSMLVAAEDSWLHMIAAELKTRLGEEFDATRERRVITH